MSTRTSSAAAHPPAVQHTSPLRHPDPRDPDLMARRAWWLLGLNLLVPGSAQLLAGSRRWGRFAVGATFTLWAVGSVAARRAIAAVSDRSAGRSDQPHMPSAWVGPCRMSHSALMASRP